MYINMTKETTILNFLNKCNIMVIDISSLNGTMIPRNKLLDKDTYLNLSGDIIELKNSFSNSSLTFLQESAYKKQKFPLINTVRQLLKTIDYKMTPVRKSAGYHHVNGKKQYERFFKIEKIKEKKE